MVIYFHKVLLHNVQIVLKAPLNSNQPPRRDGIFLQITSESHSKRVPKIFRHFVILHTRTWGHHFFHSYAV